MDIIFIIIGIVVILLIYVKIKSNNSWQSYPTLDEYWRIYPKCRTNRGTICYKCNSNYIRHHGWSERSDKRRIHICNQCGTYLYKRYG